MVKEYDIEEGDEEDAMYDELDTAPNDEAETEMEEKE